MLRLLPLLFTLLALAPGASRAASESSPDAPRALLDSVFVTARRLDFSSTLPVTSREGLQRAIEDLGLLSVRRGGPLAADLHADGFRRADIGVSVDGERYHCACPNRMDPPTTLALPGEVATVSWERTSGAPAAGLAGQLAFRRREATEPLAVRAALEGDLLRSRDGTATVSAEGRRQRVTGRWTAGWSHRDGADASFGDRYGFRAEDVRYTQADLSLRGAAGAWAWGAQGSLSRDVPYAYLLMDERDNDVWNASLAHGAWKAYANRSRHLMDNGLRTGAMRMSTAADQVTVGVTGRAADVEFEAYGRTWNAQNTIATAMTRMENHLLPRYRQQTAGMSRAFLAAGTRLSLRLGATHAGIGDASVLRYQQAVHPGAKDERWFVPFALGATRQWPVAPRTELAVGVEAASEPPTAEQLWITVRRPMMMGTKKPDWTGNPELVAPVRGTLRGQLHLPLANLELSGSWVDGYVMPVSARVGTNAHVTYANEDAALLSGRAAGHWRWAEASLAYTLGWNLDRRSPLAEIAPFMATLVARPPLGSRVQGLVRVETAAAQNRLDFALGETRASAWGRLDLGASWTPLPGWTVAAELDNVTDALYATHLAYARDPFASGLRVTEPGRAVRVVLGAGF